MAQFKVTLTFPYELIQEIDDYCKHNYLTRSGFVQIASTSYLNAHKMTKAMTELTAIIRRMADEQQKTGGVSEEDMQQLEDIERILRLMNSRDI